MAKNLAVTILGLESDIWNKTAEFERNKYNTVGIVFMFLLCSMFISGGYLLYMITSSFIFILPGSLLFTFVGGSILRFSLIIMRKSVFSSSPKIEGAEITSPNKLAFPKRVLIGFNESKLTIFGYLVRGVILVSISFLIILPISALIDHQAIKKMNSTLADSYVSNQLDLLRKKQNTSSLSIKKKIDSCNVFINSNNNLIESGGDILKNKMLEKMQLEQVLKEHAINAEVEQKTAVLKYRKQVENKFFLIATFGYLATRLTFYIISSLFLFLLFYTHWVLYQLKKNTSYTYSTESTNLYRLLIETDFSKSQDYRKQYLERNFGIVNPLFSEELHWSDAPYCTLSRELPLSKQQVSLTDFLSGAI